MFLAMELWIKSVNFSLTNFNSLGDSERLISLINTPGLLAWATIKSCSEMTPLTSDLSEPSVVTQRWLTLCFSNNNWASATDTFSGTVITGADMILSIATVIGKRPLAILVLKSVSVTMPTGQFWSIMIALSIRFSVMSCATSLTAVLAVTFSGILL